MSVHVAALASGSNGNAYYVANETEAILVDVGIHCRELERRIAKLQLSAQKIAAIFISHEHSDHICGLVAFSKKYNIPVYVTKETLRKSRLPLFPGLARHFEPGETITVGGLAVEAFSKRHDAVNPHSFVVKNGHLKVGVFTDIGSVCDNVAKYFAGCNAIFLEANYDDDMLWKGSYPFYLKRRISSDLGHLSNKQAFDLFQQYRSPELSHLILSHLSKNNNTPELVKAVFESGAGSTRITVASRYEPTGVFTVSATPDYSFKLPVAPRPSQLELSF